MSRKRSGAAPRTGTGTVRIIGGSLRGSKLAVPDSAGLRPTPDRVRETLFNWLQPVVVGARCLDLFAGSGALGIEALSRGAAAATFVEREPALAAALRDNLSRLRQDAGSVTCADALELLAASPAQACDLVFVDPPFAGDLWAAVADRLERSTWLAPQGWIYVESPVDAQLGLPARWQRYRESRAGQVRHALYRRATADPLS
jgi:16S rRNA (guanine966-N2)-methyltransferase